MSEGCISIYVEEGETVTDLMRRYPQLTQRAAEAIIEKERERRWSRSASSEMTVTRDRA